MAAVHEPGQPAAPGLFTLTAPDGVRYAARAPAADAWAGLAQECDGRWVILSAGARYPAVAAAADRTWLQDRDAFRSGWLVVPLTRGG